MVLLLLGVSPKSLFKKHRVYRIYFQFEVWKGTKRIRLIQSDPTKNSSHIATVFVRKNKSDIHWGHALQPLVTENHRIRITIFCLLGPETFTFYGIQNVPQVLWAGPQDSQSWWCKTWICVARNHAGFEVGVFVGPKERWHVFKSCHSWGKGKVSTEFDFF